MSSIITLDEGERERIGCAAAHLLNEITSIAQKHGKSATSRRVLRDEFLVNVVSELCAQIVESHNKRS